MKTMTYVEYVKTYCGHSDTAFRALNLPYRREDDAFHDVVVYTDAKHGIEIVDSFYIGD